VKPRKAVPRGGAAGLSDTGQPRASAHLVKLGPIGARRVPAGLLLVQQKSKNPLFSSTYNVFNRPKKRLDIKSCGPGPAVLALSS
jgi:hypothetical protein